MICYSAYGSERFMKSTLSLFAVGALLLSLIHPVSAAPIDIGAVGVRTAGTPLFFNLPGTQPGSAAVEFSVDGTSAHIELFDQTNLTLHVNESTVVGNSVLYDFIFTDQNRVPIMGADKDFVELGGFSAGVPVAPPNPLLDDIDPSQLEEERFFHGILFDLPALPNLGALANGFDAALVFDQDVAVGVWGGPIVNPTSTRSPEPGGLTAIGSLLVVAGFARHRRWLFSNKRR
jgi:hypothetical protein